MRCTRWLERHCMHPQCSAPILVVEDDVAVRSMLTDLLTDEGYSIHAACHGLDALNQLRAMERQPFLILLDLNMPVMTGWEFRVHQKRDPAIAHIPVAVISADRCSQQQPFAIDALEYFQKPLDIDRLLACALQCCSVATHHGR